MSDLNTLVRELTLHPNTEHRIKCYDYIKYMLLEPIFSYERNTNLKQVQGIMETLIKEQISAKLLVPIVYLIECAQKFAETAEPVCDPELTEFYNTPVHLLWSVYDDTTRNP